MRLEIEMYAEGYDSNRRLTRDPKLMTKDPTGLRSDHVIRFQGKRFGFGAIRRTWLAR